MLTSARSSRVEGADLSSVGTSGPRNGIGYCGGYGSKEQVQHRSSRRVWAYYRLVRSATAAIADLVMPPRKRATQKAAR